MKSAARFASRSDLLLRCLAVLEEQGAKPAVLHAYQDLPERITSDVDMICAQSGNACARILAFALEGTNARMVQVIRHEWTWHTAIVALDLGSAIEFLALDIGTDFRRSAVQLMSGQSFLVNRVAGQVPRAPAGVEFAAYMAKCADKGRIEPGHGEYLSAVWELDPESARDMTEQVFGSRDGAAITAAASSGQWGDLTGDLRALRSRLRLRSLVRHPGTAVVHYGQEALRRVQRATRPTGLWVVLAGLDGAGKSTLAEHLEKAVAPAFRRTRRAHLFADEALTGETRSPYAEPPYTAAVSILKAAYLFLRWWCGWIRVTRPLVSRSGLVISERSALDFVVDPARFRYKGPGWLARAVLASTPRPSVVVLVDVAPETAVRRKDELTLRQATEQAQRLRSLIGRLGGVAVSGEMLPCDVVQAASGVVLNVLEARTARRLGL